MNRILTRKVFQYLILYNLVALIISVAGSWVLLSRFDVRNAFFFFIPGIFFVSGAILIGYKINNIDKSALTGLTVWVLFVISFVMWILNQLD